MHNKTNDDQTYNGVRRYTRLNTDDKHKPYSHLREEVFCSVIDDELDDNCKEVMILLRFSLCIIVPYCVPAG